MSQICSQCGKELDSSIRFCSSCGKPVQSDSAAGTQPWGQPQGASQTTGASGMVRPKSGRMIGGVCAALTRTYGFDLIWVRLFTLLLGIFTGVGLILYLCLWAVIPSEA